MVTSAELNDRREPGCWAVLADKKYFQVGNSCIKRTLRRHEWQTTPKGVLMFPPTSYPQRWKTDAAILKYLSEHTDIPLPRFQCVFEDDGAFYHMTEVVEGVLMSDLKEDEKKIVATEISKHVETLRSLRSDTPGVPGETLMCPPERVGIHRWKKNSCWKLKEEKTNSSVGNDKDKYEYVFCHNDLGQHNVLVDLKTLKINAIIDWEFGGFWPEWFERNYWERRGPSCALEGEEDDVERCREWLLDHCEEVQMPPL